MGRGAGPSISTPPRAPDQVLHGAGRSANGGSSNILRGAGDSWLGGI